MAPRVILATASAIASLVLAGSAQSARPHWYWAPAYAEVRLAQRGLDDAACRGFGRDRIRAPRHSGSKFMFRALNCRVGGELRGLVVLGQHRFRLLAGPLGPDPAG